MNKVAIIYDDIFLKHETGQHPENANRITWTIQAIKSSPINKKIDWFKPIPASEDEIALIHSREMISYVKQKALEGGGWLDPDTYVSPNSFDAALAAAGSGKVALGLIFSQGYQQVFILARPPGHHATSSRSMGFCLFNNVALCAYIALDYKFAERVAIIDWDIHHGNGTEEIFYTDNRVFYMSVHQFPLFPGTGFEQDIGIDKGSGYNLNVPLPPGAGNNEYIRIFRDIFRPAVEKFDPNLIILSAGFDSHKLDPLGGHNLDASGYGKLAALMKEMAEKCSAKGRIIAFLEGGYHYMALADSILAVLSNWVERDSAKEKVEEKSQGIILSLPLHF